MAQPSRSRTDASPAGLGPRRWAGASAGRLAVPRLFGGVVVLMFVVFSAQYVIARIGPQENFQTLRADLARVRLQPGYRLSATRTEGADCPDRCALFQTWIWVSSGARSATAACADAHAALAAAFPRVDPDSPMRAGAACDYYSTLNSFFHPEKGTRSVEAVVDSAAPRPVVRLIAIYGIWRPS
jgi:hypothetical protein